MQYSSPVKGVPSDVLTRGRLVGQAVSMIGTLKG